MMRAVRSAAMIGAAIGAGVAIVLTTLDLVRPFSVFIDGIIESLTFRLCPLYVLGFANGMGSMTNVVIVTVIGNAILYGITFAAIAAVASLFNRRSV
jgi:hypothetical protein